MNLQYLLNSGKNIKLTYYLSSYLRMVVPGIIYRHRLRYLLKNVNSRKDFDYIMNRVNYYNKLTPEIYIQNHELTRLRDQKMCKQKVYYFDSLRYARYFDKKLKWNLIPGDVTQVPDIPSIMKSRTLKGDNSYSGLLKLNRIRHYIFVKDRKKFDDKLNNLVFRGKIGKPGTFNFKENRYLFLKKYIDHKMCNIGEINSSNCNKEFIKPKMTIKQHLDYKFILCLEGNDVASNLKWVMSSNSVAVMTRPTCETWFMEGRLIANYHYIAIKDDFSDLEEKLNYYINHPEEAKAISRHANEYVKQFRNNKREDLISLLVLKKYFEIVN